MQKVAVVSAGPKGIALAAKARALADVRLSDAIDQVAVPAEPGHAVAFTSPRPGDERWTYRHYLGLTSLYRQRRERDDAARDRNP